jgi:hypothetical protein
LSLCWGWDDTRDNEDRPSPQEALDFEKATISKSPTKLTSSVATAKNKYFSRTVEFCLVRIILPTPDGRLGTIATCIGFS